MSRSTPLKIFVIDDDFTFGNKLYDHLILNKSYEVFFFEKGSEGLQNLDTSLDIVIVDYHLDGTSKNLSNGMMILEAIKKFDPAIHVIMLTSLTHYGVAAQTIAKGAEHCVIKDDEALKNIDLIIEDIIKESR